MTDILLIILIALVLLTLVVLLLTRSRDRTENVEAADEPFKEFERTLEQLKKDQKDEFERSRREAGESARSSREELAKALASFEEKFRANTGEMNELIRQKFGDFNKQQTENNRLSSENVKNLQSNVEKQLGSIREDNTKQLEKMRETVDEKLQTTLEKRLGESFKLVSQRLEEVHKGLGEMKEVATGVGDLKKVLSNVKTRGVLGEYQLGNILEQILTPDQYERNVSTKKGSQAHVEYAVKLPGKTEEDVVWIPVDSKFPVEPYEMLLAAYDKGQPEEIESAQKVLLRTVEGFAKDISEKYLDPPNTTDFGIMFLPVESLYAEVLRHPGLFETLQVRYKITVTGPTTLSAVLNSLHMGFRTLAIQKRSSEVWKVLGAVKSEFEKFSKHLVKVRKQLESATGSLDELQTTRTNVMSRKLRDVTSLDGIESGEILEVPSGTEKDSAEGMDAEADLA